MQARFFGFQVFIEPKVQRRIVKRVGTRLATRLRRRVRASGQFRKSGQLLASIKFAMRKDKSGGAVTARGLRKDSDTHKKRKPMRNFQIAAFHAARGADVLQITSEDSSFVMKEISKEIAEELKSRVRSAFGFGR
jgi:hypothetical protein